MTCFTVPLSSLPLCLCQAVTPPDQTIRVGLFPIGFRGLFIQWWGDRPSTRHLWSLPYVRLTSPGSNLASLGFETRKFQQEGTSTIPPCRLVVTSPWKSPLYIFNLCVIQLILNIYSGICLNVSHQQSHSKEIWWLPLEEFSYSAYLVLSGDNFTLCISIISCSNPL